MDSFPSWGWNPVGNSERETSEAGDRAIALWRLAPLSLFVARSPNWIPARAEMAYEAERSLRSCRLRSLTEFGKEVSLRAT